MHWVWNHSQSKGNARIALLYVADQVRDSACEVRAGQREFMRALNTPSKSTVEKAIKDAVESGELEVAAPAAGRRPALYRLPKAVGYVRDRKSVVQGKRVEHAGRPTATSARGLKRVGGSKE